MAGSLLLAAIFGCDGSTRLPADPAGRLDSAGIAVSNNTAPLWAAGHGWVVGDSALVDIGATGAPQTALRLSDGRIVVAYPRPVGLRFHSAQGRALYEVGGAADGRGALQSLYHLDLGRGDTVVAYDMARQRAMIFDPNGAYVGAFEVGSPLLTGGATGFLPKGVAPDGRYLLQRDETPFPFPGVAGAIRPDSTRLFWLPRTGNGIDSSSRLPAGEVFGFELTKADGGTIVAPLARPMAPVLHVATGPAEVWLGDGGTWEVRGFGANGRLERIVRLPLPTEALTPALRDTFIARYRAQVRQGGGEALQQQFAAGLSAAPFPERLPAYGDLLAGEDSTLWLLHLGTGEGAPTTWSVVDAEGRWLGEVDLPPRFRPTAVGRGWVIGLQRVATGPARVRLYPLVER